MQSKLFINKLKTMEPAQKVIDLNNHLQVFDEFQKHQTMVT